MVSLDEVRAERINGLRIVVNRSEHMKASALHAKG